MSMAGSEVSRVIKPIDAFPIILGSEDTCGELISGEYLILDMSPENRVEGLHEMYVPGLTERVEKLERLIQETRQMMKKEAQGGRGGSSVELPIPAGWMR